MRVAVLGLGGVGTASARFLALMGHHVVGFEQFQLDHDRGSSYGGSRIIRKVYPDPLYAELMESAYPLWEQLEKDAGENLLLRCGGLFFGPEDLPDMRDTESALTAVGVPYERLSAREAMERFPSFRLSSREYAVYEPESGLLRASRCVRANAAGARGAGAELRENVRVDAIDPVPGGIDLYLAGERERFDRLLITGGPWTGALLQRWIQLPLTVTRQQYAHFAVSPGAPFSADRFPVWIDMARMFYGFPEHEDFPGAKVALHVPGTATDPDSPERAPRREDTEQLREYIRERFPELTGDVTYEKVCLYTMTPDEDFVVDRVPGEPRIVFVGGLSGHGFKFTILLGQVGARLAVDGTPGVPIGRFSLSRFDRRSP